MELAAEPGLWRDTARFVNEGRVNAGRANEGRDGEGEVGSGGEAGDWFPWALVGADAIAGVALAAGMRLHALRVTGHRRGGQRAFAELCPAQ